MWLWAKKYQISFGDEEQTARIQKLTFNISCTSHVRLHTSTAALHHIPSTINEVEMKLFRCHPSYGCKCHNIQTNNDPWLKFHPVTKITALSHRNDAMLQASQEGLSKFFPEPEELNTSGSENSNQHEKQWGHESLSQNSNLLWNDSSVSVGNQTDDSPLESEHTQSDSAVPTTNNYSSEYSYSQPLIDSQNSPLEENVLNSAPDIRLYSTIKRCIPDIYFRLRFVISEEAFDYILRRAKNTYPEDVQLTTMKALRNALIRYTGIELSQHPFCAHGQKALQVNSNKQIIQCNMCKAGNIERPLRFTSFGIWSQLEPLLQSNKYGPLLIHYFQQKIVERDIGEEPEQYYDLFHGRNFINIVKKFGGTKEVMNDIFLIMSTDGVQPFKSNLYSYWPIILIDANLPPQFRFKVKNILPSMFIPGCRLEKRGVGDVATYLHPLLSELDDLRNNGR